MSRSGAEVLDGMTATARIRGESATAAPRRRRYATALLVITLVAACRPTLRPPSVAGPPLERVDSVPRLVDHGDRPALAAALRASSAYYSRLPADHVVVFGPQHVSATRLRDELAAFADFVERAPTSQALNAEIARRFVAYRAVAPDGVLFTGYYLPTLHARAEPDAVFRHPILGRPRDLVTVVAADFGATCTQEIVGRVEGGRLHRYYTRAEIAAGASDAPILAWVDDPVALFFLQVQGSGTLVFPDGTRTIGFAASNGHPYVSIGKLLIDSGALTADSASMQGIRGWLVTHPEEEAPLLNANPRFIFFRPLQGPVVGSLSVPVTAGRTIATDPAVYPAGALAYVRVPSDDVDPTAADPHVARLVLNQDRGAAIRGPGRVDVFFGAGPEAEAVAGRMKTPGELYFLAPRP